MENPLLEREDGASDAASAAGRSTHARSARREPSRSSAPPTDAARRRAERRLAGRRRAAELARRARRRRATATARSSPPPDTPTLRDHLHAQLALTKPRRRATARFVDAADRRARRGRLPRRSPRGDRARCCRRRPSVELGGAADRAAPPAALRARRASARASPRECLALQLRDAAGRRRRAATLALEIVDAAPRAARARATSSA